MLTAPFAGAQTAKEVVTRVSEFAYDPTSLQLKSEKIDADIAATCVETLYTLDGYGNRSTTKVQPCGGGSAPNLRRVTKNTFSEGTNHPAGAYATASESRSDSDTGPVLAKSKASYDARFGEASSKSEVSLVADSAANNVTSRTVYDSLGRVSQVFTPVRRATDGSPIETVVEYTYIYCQGPKASTSSTTRAAAGCLTYSSAAANAPAVSVDYASDRLTDIDGKVISTGVALEVVSAYVVEATPRASAGGTIIGAKSRVHFDSLHREIVKEAQAYDGRWTRTVTAYDALGAVAATWSAHFGRDTAGTALALNAASLADYRQWTSTRDRLHRPTEQRQFWRGIYNTATVEQAATLRYNGLETSKTIPNTDNPYNVDLTTKQFKDASGQVIQTVDAWGATLNMAYDAVGQLRKTVDALGNETKVSYTATTARFKTSVTDPNQGTWRYEYDALGQLTKQTDAKNKFTQMQYDGLGRMIAKLNPTQNAYWYYEKKRDGTWCANGLGRACESVVGNRNADGTFSAIVTSEATGYDTLGRPSTTTTQLDQAYTATRAYDTLGRLNTLRYPITGLTVKYDYSVADTASTITPGFLKSVRNNASGGKVYWTIDDADITESSVFDAQGHLLRAKLGNGVFVRNTFDPISGKAFYLRAGKTTGNEMLDHQYQYDKFNDVTFRKDAINAFDETLKHDRIGRLTSYDIKSTLEPTDVDRTVTLEYNAIGNILYKSDVGGYTYGSSAGARPHAVLAVGGSSYTYDTNGQLESTTGVQNRSHTWTDFNQPASLSYSGKTVAFTYDASYKRVKELISTGGSSRTVYMVHPDNAGGLAFEREVKGSSTENRHFITAGGMVVAVVKTTGTSGAEPTDANMTNYWHRDALGSIVVVSNANGSALERMAFDPWGRRLEKNGDLNVWMPAPAHGDRGFTGHEHLDELALVHMNGRVYEPTLGRFLSADPMVQDPQNLQNYNRYTYVLNRPLAYTDPTGNCFEPFSCTTLAIAAIVSTALIVEGNQYWSMVGTIGLGFALGPGGLVEAGLGAAGTAAIGGKIGVTALAGGITGLVSSGGDLQAGLISAAAAGAFAAAGGQWGTEEALAAGNGGKLLIAHALIGCAQGALSGGRCGPSAFAAFAGKTATLGFSDGLPQFIATTIAGGTASVIGGGKFASGAAQAAFGYLFNQLVTQVAAEAAAAARNRAVMSGACVAGFEHVCAGTQKGYTEAEAAAQRAALRTESGGVADKASAGLAMTAPFAGPFAPQVAGAALALKAYSYWAVAPTSQEIIFDSVTTVVAPFATYGRAPIIDASLTFMLEIAKPALLQPKSCTIPQRC
jgi:RHS repeat-associated protein